MHFSGNYLRFDAAYHRGCKDDVADGRETYDEKLHEYFGIGKLGNFEIGDLN
jgi:hypothetical protein